MAAFLAVVAPLGIMVLATTRAPRPKRAQAPRLTMVTTRMGKKPFAEKTV
jgi:hypothetical protein